MTTPNIQALRTAADAIAKLIEDAEKEWVPSNHDTVYLTDVDTVHAWTWRTGATICQEAMRRGLIYGTQVEAERADQRRIVEVELRRLARASTDPRDKGRWMAGWCDGKWSPMFTNGQYGMPLFPSVQSCAAAIVQLGERMNLLLDGDAP